MRGKAFFSTFGWYCHRVASLHPLPAQQAGDGVSAGAAFQFLVLGGAGELLEGVLGLEGGGLADGGLGLDERQRAAAAGVAGAGGFSLGSKKWQIE